MIFLQQHAVELLLQKQKQTCHFGEKYLSQMSIMLVVKLNYSQAPLFGTSIEAFFLIRVDKEARGDYFQHNLNITAIFIKIFSALHIGEEDAALLILA